MNMFEQVKQRIKKESVNFYFYLIIIFLIVLGIYLRTKIYLYKAPLWLDEIMLSQSFIDRDILGMFSPLEANQKAPPLFLFLTFIIVKFFGYNEYSFRFIPYLSGIFSLIGFYFLLKEFFKNKISLIIGLFLFTTSMQLIYFSAEFKPYSLDVLVCILLLLTYKYINLGLISKFRALLYTLITVFFIFLSFPSGIIIASMGLSKSLEEKKLSSNFIIILFGIFCSYLYLFLYDINVCRYMIGFWFDDFSLSHSVINSFGFLLDNHSIFIKLVIPVLFLISFYVLYKEKNKYFYVLVFMYIFPIITSVLHIYAFSKRLILFLFPSLIIMLVKLFDTQEIINKKLNIVIKTITSIVIILLIIKIPYLVIPENIMIEQFDDWDRSMRERNGIKDLSLFVLDNYKSEDKLLASDEFIYSIKYYKKLYDYKTDIIFNKYDDSYDINDLEKINMETKSFIETNKHTSKIWIISSDYKNGNFRSPEFSYCKKILDENKLKYKVLKFQNDRFFMIYTLNIIKN